MSTVTPADGKPLLGNLKLGVQSTPAGKQIVEVLQAATKQVGDLSLPDVSTTISKGLEGSNTVAQIAGAFNSFDTFDAKPSVSSEINSTLHETRSRSVAVQKNC